MPDGACGLRDEVSPLLTQSDHRVKCRDRFSAYLFSCFGYLFANEAFFCVLGMLYVLTPS